MCMHYGLNNMLFVLSFLSLSLQSKELLPIQKPSIVLIGGNLIENQSNLNDTLVKSLFSNFCSFYNKQYKSKNEYDSRL